VPDQEPRSATRREQIAFWLAAGLIVVAVLLSAFYWLVANSG
jgi:hypothetical protein